MQVTRWNLDLRARHFRTVAASAGSATTAAALKAWARKDDANGRNNRPAKSTSPGAPDFNVGMALALALRLGARANVDVGGSRGGARVRKRASFLFHVRYVVVAGVVIAKVLF